MAGPGEIAMADFTKAIGRRVRSNVGGPSRTKQSFRDQTDINLIVKNHTEGAHIPLPTRQPTYGDFSAVVDLRTAIETVEAADAAFMALPADVRTAALNEPDILLEMLANEDGAQRLVDAGLPVQGLEKTPEPTEPPVVQPPAEPIPVSETSSNK